MSLGGVRASHMREQLTMKGNMNINRHKSRFDTGAHKHSTLRSGDWFGCGRVITTESWNRFLAARKAYWEKKDAEDAEAAKAENKIQPESA